MKFKNWIIEEDWRRRQEHLRNIDSAIQKLWHVIRGTGNDPSKVLVPGPEGKIIDIKLSHPELVELLVNNELASEKAAPRFAAGMISKIKGGLEWDDPGLRRRTLPGEGIPPEDIYAAKALQRRTRPTSFIQYPRRKAG